MNLSGRRTIVRMLLAAAALLGMAAPPLSAQSTGTVSGTIVQADNRQPLAGVRVTAGSGQSAVTSSAGEYTLAGVPAGRVQVRAQMLGFAAATATVTVAAGATARADLALAAASVSLDAIVVTGTPGATSRRELGNSMVKLDAAEVTEKTTVSDVTEILQSRTPGVQILSNSGTPGAAADIVVRGAGSLTSVRPVIYVDGIRYSDASLGNFGASGAGTQSFSTQVTSALSFINPEDIESIEVLKGPAAATLYGAEAAAGVIQVITKKGPRGEQRTRWNVKYERGRNEIGSEVTDNFTTCTRTFIDSMTVVNGVREPVFPGCQGQSVGTVLRQRSPILDDPFGAQGGDLNRVSLSVRGGGDRATYYVAGDLDHENGVFSNSFNNRRSVRANFTAYATEQLNFNLSTNYVRNHLRLPVGDESGQGLYLLSTRGIPGRRSSFPNVFPGYPGSVGGAQAVRYDNQTYSDRTTLGATANYTAFDWFRNKLTLGLDLTQNEARLISPPGSTDADFAGTPEGLSALRYPRSRVYTADYVGTAEFPLTGWLESSTSFGTQYIARRFDQLSGTGTGLGAPDITTIQNAAVTTGTSEFTEVNSIGYYVQQQFSVNNRLFLIGALRADDFSSFGEEFDVIVYPKAQVSYVVSEEPALEGFFNTIRAADFKLRGAYGQAGRAPSANQANQTYTVVKVTMPTASGVTTVNGVRTVNYGNPNLEPERGEEYEAGFEASFLENRIGVDFTYYNKRTDNLLQAVSIAPSEGFFAGRTENLGDIRNTGVELLISATPVQRRGFAWESRLNLATNKNELLTFGQSGLFRSVLIGQAYGAVQENRAGYPLGGFWAQLPVRGANGGYTFNNRNVPVVDTALTYLGPPAPTREIGLSNTFTLFRNVRVFTQLDYKGGNKIFNYKEYNRCRFQVNCERVNDIRVLAPGSAADSAFARDVGIYRGQAVTTTGAPVNLFAPYVEDGDFIKLRDVSVSFTIPSRFVAFSGASDASFTLAGRNLATLWTKYSGIDPEVNTYGNRSFVRVDAYAMPQNRRVTAAINVNF